MPLLPLDPLTASTYQITGPETVIVTVALRLMTVAPATELSMM